MHIVLTGDEYYYQQVSVYMPSEGKACEALVDEVFDNGEARLWSRELNRYLLISTELPDCGGIQSVRNLSVNVRVAPFPNHPRPKTAICWNCHKNLTQHIHYLCHACGSLICDCKACLSPEKDKNWPCHLQIIRAKNHKLESILRNLGRG
jgi:predicted RNA-binding Zn-ribbon protein involved in translation (DUF1610 family)